MHNDTTTSARAARVLLWAGPAATIIGLVMHRMWEHIASTVGQNTLALALGVGVSGWLLHRVLRWQPASCIATIWLVLLVAFAGPLPVLATSLLAIAALGLGSTLLPAALAAPCMRALFALLGGLALIAGTLGWLLPLPIHRIWIYLPALLVLAIWRRAAVRALLVPLPAAWRAAATACPGYAALAALVVGLASTACWLPTMQFDDLSYHLALPSQLQLLGYYRLDFASNLWALAPWSGDVLHALVQLLANTEARGALDALWLVLTASLLWELGASLDLEHWACALLVTLYASQPIVMMLAGGMQTEGPATAVTLALALLVMRAPDEPDPSTLRLAAVLTGLLLGLKILHAVAIPPMLLWLLYRWRGRLPWRALPTAIALCLLVGGSSYAYAFALTGNPLLPLYNGLFRSPAYDAINVVDARWSAGLHWDLPWQITFDAPRYMESFHGGAGFVLVALSGALLLALLNRKTRALTLAGLVVTLLPLSQLQYLRYAQPGLVLLLPALVAAATMVTGRRSAAFLLSALVGLNLAFQTSANWMLQSGVVEKRVEDGTTATVAQFAPERSIAAYLRARPEQGSVLYTGNPFFAELAGRGFVVVWYDRALSALASSAEHDASGAAWRAAFARIGVRWVETTPSQASPALKAALAGAERVLVVGDADLWHLPPSPNRSGNLPAERDTARSLLAH